MKETLADLSSNRPSSERNLSILFANNAFLLFPVGYSTCHWCHVMERESFEDEEVAKILNEHFVSIKVDREERPDVDRVYMTFVQVQMLIELKKKQY